MNLLLNTESLTPPLTGIGNYTFNLLEQLSILKQIDNIECFSGQHFSSASETLARCQMASATPTEQENTSAIMQRSRLRALIRRIPFAYRARALLHNYHLRRREQHRHSFVYHEPNFILKEHDGPSVATIHDLSFIHYPEHHPIERVSWMTSQLPATLKRADFLITPSELIRQELIGDLGVSPEKVRSIYLGAADCFRPYTPEETRTLLQRHNLQHGQYVLFVASLEPRKGVDILLDAWSSLPEALRRAYPLVLAGAPGWKNQELQARIRGLQASHGLRHLNYVPSEDLPALYAGAGAFVYPSIYEGFGLPVLEAMQCGIPVICTAGTTMDEFSAGSTLLCERGNSEHLRDQLQILLEDDDLRTRIAKAGRERAQTFSWRRCAEQTLQVYELIKG